MAWEIKVFNDLFFFPREFMMISKARKQLVIYDLDGTLVDTRKDIAEAANHLRQTMNLPPLAENEVRHFVGRGLHYLIKSLLGTEDAKAVEKGAKIYREYYRGHMLDHSRLYPGAADLLKYFSDRKQAIMTNKPNPFSRDMLTRLGVADSFMEIIAGDSVYPKKPDPSAVRFLMERAGSRKEETLFIGDSLIDIETSRKAGIPIVVVLHGFSNRHELESGRPDAVVKDFQALLKLAKKEGW